ncbi:hypothetical protein [Planctomicrobium piriforme]|uniref:Uncharacterized protein n=1 Tax=Planctomicrobium piriforme TaxID=1576369 RepID=A0A1I3B4Y7_9PLAN|nr:hypothetical protein [Planctomicrobium piriforme]SFH57357.1 hypothetical protein SAMN05421753_101240 [Planctomicrobium piriforme]
MLHTVWPEIPKPSPLEEWLKGREVLTVKQDGNAMFSTSQAAPEKQQTGQVVVVLDKEPDRESRVISQAISHESCPTFVHRIFEND